MTATDRGSPREAGAELGVDYARVVVVVVVCRTVRHPSHDGRATCILDGFEGGCYFLLFVSGGCT